MKEILIVVLLIVAQTSYAQVPDSSLNKSQKLYFETLVQLSNFLKEKETTLISLHDGNSYSIHEALYDTVVNLFFNKEKMLSSFATDTSVFAVEGKLDMLRHMLNGFDNYLDKEKSESILIEPNYTLSKASVNEGDEVLDVFILQNNKKRLCFQCLFDSGTNKLVGFIGDFVESQ